MNHLNHIPEQMPPHVLAYIGDAVYELFIRAHLINLGITKVNQLHKEAIRYVNASAQAGVLHVLEGSLTEVELSVVRRGRNAKSGRVPKNADMIDYRYATAFEALTGYLYLKDEQNRLKEIFQIAISIIEQPREVKNDEGKAD